MFGKALLHALKTLPPGTSDRTIMLEALRSVPADKLDATLAKATPHELSRFFGVIPADQVKTVLGSIPPAKLGPSDPPGPVPSPPDGPPASILQTTYTNEPYPPAESDLYWAQKITDGKTIHDLGSGVFEWTPVYDPDLEKEGPKNPVVGLTGWVVPAFENPGGVSSADVWFTHPFGSDWEYYIAPDPQYENLLAVTNTGRDPADGTTSDSGYFDATDNARERLALEAPFGVIGVEIDQALVPWSFQKEFALGARVATFGRWIVDTGHPDFHTEIHPPLLMAIAKNVGRPLDRSRASEATRVEIMSRPYTVSQRFPEGTFVDHLLVEVLKVEDTTWGWPSSWQVEAHPTVYTTPYDGFPCIKLLVEPPVPRKKVGLQRLMVRFHFTCREGVNIRVFDAGNDNVGIIVLLGALKPAELPGRRDLTILWEDLGSDYNWIIDGLQLLDILTVEKTLSAIALARGINTDSYDAPVASSPLDNQGVAGPVAIDQLDPRLGSSLDDAQPFPIYGWLEVFWEEEELVSQPNPV